MGLRVLHLISGRSHGRESQFEMLAHGLGRRAVPQIIFTARGTPFAHRLAEAGLPVFTVPWRWALDPRVLPGSVAALRTCTLLHAHDADALQLARVAQLWRRAPLVATRWDPGPVRRAKPWRAADRILVHSEAARQAVLGAGVLPDRLVRLPPAVDVDRVALPSDEPRAPHATSAVLLAPATDRLMHETAQLLGDRRVKLVLGDEDPRPLLQHASALVLAASEEEPDALILEAFARGVPVIVSRGAPGDHGGWTTATFSASGGAAALANAVRHLLDDPAEAAHRVQAGREIAKRYDLGLLAEQVERLYRSLTPSLSETAS